MLPPVITRTQRIYDRNVIPLCMFHVPHNGRIIIFNWINLNRITPINPRPDDALRFDALASGTLRYEHYELLQPRV